VILDLCDIIPLHNNTLLLKYLMKILISDYVICIHIINIRGLYIYIYIYIYIHKNNYYSYIFRNIDK